MAAVVVVEGTAVVVSGLDEVGQLRGGAPGRVLLHPGEAVIAAAPSPASSHHQALSVGNRDPAALAGIINTSSTVNKLVLIVKLREREMRRIN